MRMNYRRAERKLQVIIMMSMQLRDHGVRWHTITGIAKRLDIKPSQHIRNIVEELVKDGDLIKETEPYREGWTRSYYRLADHMTGRPLKPLRQVNINHKGKSEAMLI